MSNRDVPVGHRQLQGEVDEIACKLVSSLCEPFKFAQSKSNSPGIWMSSGGELQIVLGLFGNTETELRLFCSKVDQSIGAPYSELVVDLADDECQNKITNWLERVTS